MEIFKEVMLPAIGLCMAVMLITGIPAYFLSRASCHAKWEGSGYQTDFGVFSGCRINVKGQWIPSDSLRSIKEAQE